jgi:hypothetical protein
MNFEKNTQKDIDRASEEELVDVFEREELLEKQFEKPDKLFRGTRKQGIEEFDPKNNKKFRDKNEGPVVFATPDKAFASMFLVPEADDSWTIKGRLNGNWYTVIADREMYEQLDKGGSIYEIDDLDDFYCDEQKGMGKCEWVNKEKIKPAKEEQFDSALDAMLRAGVQVYFVDKDTFLKIKNSDDYGMSILRKIKSEKIIKK